MEFDPEGTEAKRMESENEQLTKLVNAMEIEIGQLTVEAQEARRSMTALQLAVSILVFLYGIMYGKYFNC